VLPRSRWWGRLPEPIDRDDVDLVVVAVGRIPRREQEAGVELVAEGVAQGDEPLDVSPVDLAGRLDLETRDSIAMMGGDTAPTQCRLG
jgi:hypothetical protein